MVFDDQTLVTGRSFAANLCEACKDLSLSDRTLILLGFCLDVPLFSPDLEELRLNMKRNHSEDVSLLFAIVSLCELGCLANERVVPPVRVVDIMSHIQIYRDTVPAGAIIQCHGDAMLPLALWYASIPEVDEMVFTGDKEACSVLARKFGSKVRHAGEDEPFVSGAWHFASLVKNGPNIAAFCRKLFNFEYKGAVILTTWSFLNCTTPRTLQLKQKMISTGNLRSVIQLPSGIMPRVLPALIQLAPSADKSAPIRVVDAKDWFFFSNDKTIEVSYLSPILNRLDRCVRLENERNPVPPTMDLERADVLLRQCDLRIEVFYTESSHNGNGKWEHLDECALLVRGQMLPQNQTSLLGHSYREVMLTDIDEFGRISRASRQIENVPALMRSREVALLKKNDILFSFKGSLSSLGTIGIIEESNANWLPNQTFYLVRAEMIDPLWLFYFLRSKTAQNYFRSHISGTSVPQIKIADIAALRVPVPDSEKLKEVYRYHEEISKCIRKIRKIREEYIKIEENCANVFS